MIRTFLRFLITGGTTFLVQMLSLALCYDVLSLPYKLAISLAFVLALCCHFGMNRFYTFGHRGLPCALQIKRYLKMVVINYLITFIVTSYTVDHLHLSVYLGTVASIAATVILGFFLSKYWVFAQEHIEHG